MKNDSGAEEARFCFMVNVKINPGCGAEGRWARFAWRRGCSQQTSSLYRPLGGGCSPVQEPGSDLRNSVPQPCGAPPSRQGKPERRARRARRARWGGAGRGGPRGAAVKVTRVPAPPPASRSAPAPLAGPADGGAVPLAEAPAPSLRLPRQPGHEQR